MRPLSQQRPASKKIVYTDQSTAATVIQKCWRRYNVSRSSSSTYSWLFIYCIVLNSAPHLFLLSNFHPDPMAWVKRYLSEINMLGTFYQGHYLIHSCPYDRHRHTYTDTNTHTHATLIYVVCVCH